MSESNLSGGALGLIEFLLLCGRLKTTKRTGWVRNGVNLPESIGDHMHRMGVMALAMDTLSAGERDRAMRMAIVHDLAEAIAGDITPHDPVSKEEKYRLESEGLHTMVAHLDGGNSGAAKQIVELWEEYEEGESEVARFVKDLDKLEMLIQVRRRCFFQCAVVH
ncbi:HD domain-containing protein 2 [Chytriomyces sp. MP71]|nr:HD domain-containing protein 2 [Chytriomyces sp. MP71]